MLARIVKRYDAFTNPYHIRSQAHASIPMELKRIKQVVTNSVICDRSEIGRLRKKKIVCHYGSYHDIRPF